VDGKCHYGDKCNFDHILPNQATNAGGFVPKGMRPCRHLRDHGFCKYQGKGCEFNHDIPRDAIPNEIIVDNPEPKVHINQHTYNMQPAFPLPPENSPTMFPAHTNYEAFDAGQFPMRGEFYGSPYGIQPGADPYRPAVGPMQFPLKNSSHRADQLTPGTSAFYYSRDVAPQSFLPYLPSMPHVANRQTPRRGSPTSNFNFFVRDDIRKEIFKQCRATNTQLHPEDPLAKNLPSSVHMYHSLYPLDDPLKEKSLGVFGYLTWLYKCICKADNMAYVLWRLDGFRLTNEASLSVREIWSSISHPNIVKLCDIFTTNEFGDNSTCFVYEYHPCSITLQSAFLKAGNFLSEDILWSFIVQLVSALQTIHNANLPCRVIHPSKIILSGKNRIHITGVGIFDVLNYDGSRVVSHFQMEDLLALGKLVLCLACRSGDALQDVNHSLEIVSKQYSTGISQLIRDLLSMKVTSVIQLYTPAFNQRALQNSVHLHNYADALEADISKEIESGRLLRLIMKLEYITDRPEHAQAPRWKEGGDRYILKLFRDYLFHQVYEDGSPAIDYGHIVDTLNKLDVGSTEKVVLVGRDEKSILVVSYEDIRRAVNDAFKELTSHVKNSVPYRRI